MKRHFIIEYIACGLYCTYICMCVFVFLSLTQLNSPRLEDAAFKAQETKYKIQDKEEINRKQDKDTSWLDTDYKVHDTR
jgi:hypothetical protein